MKPRGKPVFAGNWKMHKCPSQTRAFFASFFPLLPPADDRTVLFFPPAVSLATAAQCVEPRPDIRLGVQNVHWKASGAFTGEIAAGMAAEAGAEFALVGHSERRHLFGETNPQTADKVTAAMGAGLHPVLCVGETLQERRAGRAEATVEEQLRAVLPRIHAEHAGRLLIAYEPVWAIGTGETASPADAASMHAFIRAKLTRHFVERAETVPILYGGSVNAENAGELLAAREVDGVLVGGASLDPEEFARICAAGA